MTKKKTAKARLARPPRVAKHPRLSWVDHELLLRSVELQEQALQALRRDVARLEATPLPEIADRLQTLDRRLDDLQRRLDGFVIRMNVRFRDLLRRPLTHGARPARTKESEP